MGERPLARREQVSTIVRTCLAMLTTMALAGCGTTASPEATVQASSDGGAASQAPAIAVICNVASVPFDPNHIELTGAWAGDDGGIYYIRQLGSVVWWNGMSDREASPLALGRGWNNVGRGEINGLEIEAEWADVPRSGGELGHGALTIDIQDDGTGNTELLTVDETGGFGNISWMPCEPVEGLVADYVRTYGGEASQYGLILTLDECGDLVSLKDGVTVTLDTADAGSPEFRAALGYSNAISQRLLKLDC